jgi:hypothetical protein
VLDVAGSEVNEGMSDVVDDDEEDVSCDVDVERMEVDVSRLEVKVVESDETLSNVGVEVGSWLTSGACGDGESCGPLVVGSVLSEMIAGSSSLGC